MGRHEVVEFLTYLAVQEDVAASTQNQALSAVLFLYKVVLHQDLERIEDVVRAHKSKKLPVVLTREEVKAVLQYLSGPTWLMASLLYGSGLRLLECLRLRAKDIDFAYHQITVRDGKGSQDRVTMLPLNVKSALQQHLQAVKQLHDRDLEAGFGNVYLPYALERKYPYAARAWAWQYVFPAAKRSHDPRSGMERRHHVLPLVLQRAVKAALRRAGITKAASCHSFRHSFATISLKMELIFVLSRNYWVTRTSIPRWSIPTCYSVADKVFGVLGIFSGRFSWLYRWRFILSVEDGTCFGRVQSV
jgi:integron integrase